MDDLVPIIIGVFIAIFGIAVAVLVNPIRNIQMQIASIQNDLKGSVSLSALSSQSYLEVLSKEWKFWEKLFKMRKDKILISNKIVDTRIEDHDKIIVDSGTTIDQIPRILNEKFFKKESLPLIVYTNNLIAAISVIPPSIRVYLLGGDIDSIYGATYHSSDPALPLKDIEPQKIILAATAISFEDGPMVSTRDTRNQIFKETLINKADKLPNCTLIIAADWTKFKKIDLDETSPKMQRVVNRTTWGRIRDNKDKEFYIYLTEPDSQDTSPAATEAKAIIKQFKDNGGIKVVKCNKEIN